MTALTNIFNRIHSRVWIAGLLIGLLNATLYAEPVAPAPVSPDSPEAIQKRLYALKQRAQKALLAKLKKGEDWITIQTFPLIDYTNLNSKEFFRKMVEETFQSYEKEVQVGEAKYELTGISLERLRIGMATTQTDLAVAAVVMPTNIDVYLYDKRNPFKIYAQSEAFLEGNQEALSVPMAEHYSKLAFRRALFRYISNQPYDLPRDGSPPILRSEVPRVIASYQTVDMINREASANFYVSANWGAAISRGFSGKLWNSSLISLELAWNFVGRWFLEAAGEISAYNMGVASVKYLVSDREEPFRLMLGIGGAVLSNRHTFDWDQSNDIRGRQFYAVPSLSVLFPISDVYLKLESRAFVGVNGQSHIFTIMPGLHIWF